MFITPSVVFHIYGTHEKMSSMKPESVRTTVDIPARSTGN
jgi:hypothetical protein